MNVVNYFLWERYLRSGDYESLGKLPLNNAFIFYTLQEIEGAESCDIDAMRPFASMLKRKNLTVWERMELSTYAGYEDIISDDEVNELLAYLKDSVIRKQTRTIVHVHVPKAAGTSVNAAFMKEYYKPGTVLPGNNTPRAMRLVLDRLAGIIPFIGTGHIPLDWLIQSNSIAEKCNFFMVSRDHDARINSMRNQILASLATGTFFDRPFAYARQFYIGEMLNIRMFPLKNKQLVNTVSSSLSSRLEDAAQVIDRYGVEVVDFKKLADFLQRRFNVVLEHGSKNRTYNVSRYLPRIPRQCYRLDEDLLG